MNSPTFRDTEIKKSQEESDAVKACMTGKDQDGLLKISIDDFIGM